MSKWNIVGDGMAHCENDGHFIEESGKGSGSYIKALARLGKLALLFVAIIFTMVILLIAASAIPNEAIIDHQTQGITVLDAEGSYPKYFYDRAAAQLDNVTDREILKQTINKEGDTPLVCAMHGSYARYWHGYSIYMRPLLVFFSLYDIRYLFMVVYFLLFGLSAILIAKKIDLFSAFAFVLAIAMSYMVVVATSLQFVPMFLISFIAIILLLSVPAFSEQKVVAFFLVIGMVTNYFDFLTVPIISLGLPLIVLALMKDRTSSFQEAVALVLPQTFSWFAGYGMTWASKWLLGSIVLKKNIFQQAATAIVFRTMGSNDMPASHLIARLGAIKRNIGTMLRLDEASVFTAEFYQNHLFLICGIAFIIFIILVAFQKNTKQNRWGIICLVCIACYPFVWYFVLSNHSLIHHFFTFRAQVVSIFAIIACFGRCIDWNGFPCFNLEKGGDRYKS